MPSRSPFLANMGLALVTLALTLCAVEFGLRLVGRAPKGTFGPSQGLFIADSVLAYRHAPNFSGIYRASEFEFPIFTNSQGLFDAEYKGESPTILAIGDSYVFGMVSLKDNWMKLLEKSVGVRVVAAGHMGYGLKQEFGLQRQISPQYRPSLIIVAIFLNDLIDDYMFPSRIAFHGFLVNRNGINVQTGETSAIDSVELESRYRAAYGGGVAWARSKFAVVATAFKASDRIGRLLCRGKEEICVDDKTDAIIQSAMNPHLGWGPRCYDSTLTYLERMHTCAGRSGSAFLAVIIPAKEQVYPTLSGRLLKRFPGIETDFFNRKVAVFCESHEIPLLDLLPVFKRNIGGRADILDSTDFFYKEDGHFNVSGNRLAARSLELYLRESKMIPLQRVGDRGLQQAHRETSVRGDRGEKTRSFAEKKS